MRLKWTNKHLKCSGRKWWSSDSIDLEIFCLFPYYFCVDLSCECCLSSQWDLIISLWCCTRTRDDTIRDCDIELYTIWAWWIVVGYSLSTRDRLWNSRSLSDWSDLSRWSDGRCSCSCGGIGCCSLNSSRTRSSSLSCWSHHDTRDNRSCRRREIDGSIDRLLSTRDESSEWCDHDEWESDFFHRTVW